MRVHKEAAKGQLSRLLNRVSPAWTIVFGYAVYMVLLYLFLRLPFALESDSANWLDHAFVAVSAVSTTGLSTIDVGSTYSFWGELALAVAIQLGGLGYMTLGSFVLLTIGNRLSGNRIRIGRLAFHLPPTFALRPFLKRVVAYTVFAEALGAIMLWQQFTALPEGQPRVWAAVFHSISAFCTAGFSIFPNSLELYRDNVVVNIVIVSLSLAGALGFILFSDVWSKLRNWSEHHFSLTSKVILVSTTTAIATATAVLYFSQSQLSALPGKSDLLVAFFQAVSALTTVGFNTYPVNGFMHSGLFLLLLLMTLGASPAGTGGGLKCTTWVTGLAAVTSALSLGRSGHVIAFGREIATRQVVAAFAAITLYILCFCVGTFMLLFVEPNTDIAALTFEAASALGTVGLSTGITAELGEPGRWIIMTLMLIGRAGPITIAVALASIIPSHRDDEKDIKEEDIVL